MLKTEQGMLFNKIIFNVHLAFKKFICKVHGVHSAENLLWQVKTSSVRM